MKSNFIKTYFYIIASFIICLSFYPQNAVAAGMFESFENCGNVMPPAGWQKWQISGGRGWSNVVAGTQPFPGWMSGTISVPPCEGAGSRVAYATYTHGGSKINDLWLVSPKLNEVTLSSTLSFWYNFSFTNFADKLYVMISTNDTVSSPADFMIQAYHISTPRDFPANGNFMPWSNIVVNIGAMVPEGSDIYIAFREYYHNNWYDVKALELDVIETDLWSSPTLTTKSVRVTSPTTIEIDYDLFAGYPAGRVGVCWSSDPEPVISYDSVTFVQGDKIGVITNFPNDKTYYLRLYAKHESQTTYGKSYKISPGGSAGEGLLFESFENLPARLMPPSGWLKNQPSGGSGWSNWYSGRQPMPGWQTGEITVPPCEGSGSKVAYVSYREGGSKINDNWLISPQIENIPPDYELSFWWNFSFTNFADNLYVYLSTTGNQPEDFTTQLLHIDSPRLFPANGNFMPWSNNVVNISDFVDPGEDVYIAFREYYPNNWYDVKALELDVISAGNIVRNALYFDGVDDEVVLNITNDFSAYTIEAWVKPDSAGGMSIIVGTDNDPTANFSRQLRMTAAGQFEHYLWDGTAERYVTGTTVAQIGKWYHVTGTAVNNGDMRLLVNGTEEGSAVAIGTAQPVNNVHIGSASGHAKGFFNGDIDEVRIWSIAKNQEQIRDAMNIYLRGVEDNLVACYRLDNTFGHDVFDSSIPANDFWFGSRLDSYAWNHHQKMYNGIDDYDVIPQPTIPPDYTIEAWVCPSDTSPRNIMVFTDGNPLTSYTRQLQIDNSGRFRFYSYDGTVRVAFGTTVLIPGQWYYVVGTAINGDKMRLYVNGVEEDYDLAGNTLWASGNQYQIGVAAGYGSDWFKGRMHNVAVTNYAKTELEIVSSYTSVAISNVNPSTYPQWTESEAPLGDCLASKNYNNFATWEVEESNSDNRGLTVETFSSSISNFVVFGDNNLTGRTVENLSSELINQNFSRLNSVWYFDVHGSTNQLTKLTFNPSNSSASFDGPTTNNYKLLYRENESDTFIVIRESADSINTSNVVFNNVVAEEGFYSLAGQDIPTAPTAQPADEIHYNSFRANWLASFSATNYFIDVSTNNTFATFVTGYNNEIIGNVTNLIVTNLLTDTIYYYRLRSENAAGTSPDSNIIQTRTLQKPEPEIATNALIFPSVDSLVFASSPTNIIWDVEKITDDIDGTNLTITSISLHYADTESWIADVTNNINNILGEIEWYVPDGNWDNETNYILRFEVVNSFHITNSRFLSDNIFALVPEGGIILLMLSAALVTLLRRN